MMTKHEAARTLSGLEHGGQVVHAFVRHLADVGHARNGAVVDPYENAEFLGPADPAAHDLALGEVLQRRPPLALQRQLDPAPA